MAVQSAAPNAQLQDLMSVMMSKLDPSGLSAEDRNPAEGSAGSAPGSPGPAPAAGSLPAAGNKPPDVNSPATGGEAVTVGPDMTPAGVTAAAAASNGAPPAVAPNGSAASNSASSPAPDPAALPANAAGPDNASASDTSSGPDTIGALIGEPRLSTLPAGLTPVPLPEGVPTDALPPGAVPIKVEEGKITFAVVGKKPAGRALGGLDIEESDDEIMKTTLIQKILRVFRHLRIVVWRWLRERWDHMMGVAVTGSRALGETVDNTKSFLSVTYSIIATLLRRLADFVEQLPPTRLSSLTAVLISLPMMPLNVIKAISEHVFNG